MKLGHKIENNFLFEGDHSDAGSVRTSGICVDASMGKDNEGKKEDDEEEGKKEDDEKKDKIKKRG